MNSINQFENLTVTERVVRFFVSAGVIIAAMQSSLVGTPAFAVLNILAVALATTAIIGWDPAKALGTRRKNSLAEHADHHHGHHV